jgi:beta-lactamase class D
MKLFLRIFLFVLVIDFSACKRSSEIEVKDDFRKYYRQNQLEGCFTLYDLKRDRYIFCNKQQAEQGFIPSSTFKICNTLIGLETGVVKDGNSNLSIDSTNKTDSVEEPHTQTLKSAFQSSTIGYYQELARRIGQERMKYWLDKAEYGNRDMTGGIDQFWLTGGLRISPLQQVDFLKRLYTNKLPFSDRSMNEVKNIMLMTDTTNFVLHGKTGWGEQDNTDIGWFVGYVETHNNVYIFANFVQSRNPTNPYFEDARKQIVFRIMKDLNIIS